MTGKDIFVYYDGAFFAAFTVRGDEVASQCEAVEISGRVQHKQKYWL